MEPLQLLALDTDKASCHYTMQSHAIKETMVLLNFPLSLDVHTLMTQSKPRYLIPRVTLASGQGEQVQLELEPRSSQLAYNPQALLKMLNQMGSLPSHPSPKSQMHVFSLLPIKMVIM